ncbi:ABC transporter ATP-binding protein [Paenibacillus arenosi]|uniref:Quaternary amine transport ATP-binding protein n=1 Tax=Paenibacillus arenosi TaxID=2774142 RepID=A0ABR9AXK1_9BACL|nr:betaine/proline/choline family ABC transporter ATP-binding protein [Paenibacillus arenosi]MBD8498857.1 betaine/proline/choline family ABC transporter ATP-binding protein [Paenibacillus arenosi]
MIEFQQVNKKYDDGFQALTDINLTIKKGELTAFIGPSGCGKSTTMKHINRLISPTSGRIFIDGKDISEYHPVELRRNIGYVIQNVGLFPHMTIAKNIAIVPQMKNWDKAKIDKRVTELLQLVNLDPDTYRNRYPSELSGGQQQRVGVARALAADPDIILMDEPFSALDPITREQLQEELVRLQEDVHKTIVFVTHDMDEAIKIADTIVLMKDGQIVQSGSPEAILRRPANDFVRSFIGQKRIHTNDKDENEMELDDASLSMTTVDEVMVTQPATTSPNRGLAEAIKIMEARKVDSLFVVDKNRTLLGIVSIYRVLNRYGDESLTVKDVMKPIGYQVGPGTPLPIAVEQMTNHRLTNLAVVDDSGRLVGLITRGSIVKHLNEVYPAMIERFAWSLGEEA